MSTSIKTFWDDFETTRDTSYDYTSIEYALKSLKTLKEELPFCGWFIAGGFGVALIEKKQEKPTPYNDIDIFFDDEKTFEMCFDLYSKKHNIKYESQFAVTFDDNIQFVKFQYGTPREVLERFDLNICRVAYEPYLEMFTDLRGDTPKEIKIVNPTNYSLLQRVKKYMYRDYTISLEELKKLRTLMTTDGLSELTLYGEHTIHKMDTRSFLDAVFAFFGTLNPKYFYLLFEDIDFMEIVQDYKDSQPQHSRLYGAIAYLDMLGLPNICTEEQRWAIKWNNNCLDGEDYKNAIGKYPDYFV